MARQLIDKARYDALASVPHAFGVVSRAARTMKHQLSRAIGLRSVKGLLRAIAIAVLLAATMTLCLLGVTRVVELRHVSIAYLIPVLVAAVSAGVTPAVITALCSIAASAFVFYPPIWDLRISDPQHVLDVLLFVVVAMVTGKLATTAQSHALLAEDRERAMRSLYAFSKRLAVATEETHIYAAIEEHLSSITGCPVAYIAPDARPPTRSDPGTPIPDGVRNAIGELAQGLRGKDDIWVDDEHGGGRWLIRPLSRTGVSSGLVAVEIGKVPMPERDSLQQRIDAALADASDTLERLDMARVIGLTKLRAEAETLRTALIGSVSHGLRTPLASIMGSASILVQAPSVAADPRLAALAGIVRDEAGILNDDIQKLLDASSISSAGVRARMSWADLADIVNTAVTRLSGRPSGHQIRVELSEDLPFVHIDPMLIEQALRLVIDNAVKYSAPGSAINIRAASQGREVTISVRDEGIGLSSEERQYMFERFYRGPRTRDTTSGSGLGLWIARAFVAACGGRIEAESKGIGRGTTVTILLCQASAGPEGFTGGADG